MNDILNKSEKKAVSYLMNILDDALGNAGCNDMELENTPENRELVKNAIIAGYSKKEAVEELKEFMLYYQVDLFDNPIKKTIITGDYLIFSFLKKKLGLTKD